jgi:dihydrofolate reductase
MFNRITIDGSFATGDGSLDWVIPEPEVDREGASGTGSADTILFGRRTYDMLESFWPNIGTSGDAPDPHHPGRGSPEMATFAKMIIFGSGTIVSQLSAHKLIDAYEFIVSPLLLGNGKHLFAALTQTVPLELRGVKSYPSGTVRLSYCRHRL